MGFVTTTEETSMNEMIAQDIAQADAAYTAMMDANAFEPYVHAVYETARAEMVSAVETAMSIWFWRQEELGKILAAEVIDMVDDSGEIPSEALKFVVGQISRILD